MNESKDPQLLARLASLLPSVQEWIEEYRSRHEDRAIPVDRFGFQRLDQYFGPELRHKARAVPVERISFPPLSQMGFPYFQELEEQEFGGITYRDMYFLTPEAYSGEATHFHELVHVVQWDVLGPTRFLSVYGIGLLSGYRQSPLEVMAYDFEASFKRGALIPDLEQTIRTQTIGIADGLGM